MWWGENELSRVIFTILLMFSLATAQNIFESNGKPFAKVKQRYREPKIVVDTVRMVSGFGYSALNNSFTKGQHAVGASVTNVIYAVANKLLSDSSDTVFSYGIYPKSEDTLLIKSSDSGDTGKVQVIMILK